MSKCVKQDVVAIIKNRNKIFIGINSCNNPQFVCPRDNMPSGIGYELCKSICRQTNHAEVNACINAGEYASGATLYLIGHSYCCDDCLQIMKEYGIKEIIIL